VEVSGKVGSMKALVMERVMVILIRWLLRKGRILETTQEVLFEVFDVGILFLEAFDVGRLVLEDLNC
jgi:hypothetical protein